MSSPTAKIPTASLDKLRALLLENGLDAAKWKALDDYEFIKIIGETFKYELNILKEAEACAEAGADQSDHQTPSRTVVGKDYDEVNRTLTSVLALKWVLANNRDTWVSRQPEVIKLKQGTFEEIRALFVKTLAKKDATLALVVSLLISDLGKAPQLFPGGERKNHDQLIVTAAENNRLPSLNALRSYSSEHAENVMHGLRLGSALNIAQLAQGENVPGCLAVLQPIMQNHPESFDLKYLELLLDVAGASGHRDCRGASSMIEPVARHFLDIKPTLNKVIEGKLDCQQAYDWVLQKRADLLKQGGFKELSMTNREQRALVRILLMSRTANKQQAELVEGVFNGLPDKTRKWLVDGLNNDGWKHKKAVLPYYAPAMIVEGMGAKDKAKGLKAVLEYLARVFHDNEPKENEKPSVVEVHLKGVVDCVKGQAFKDDPSVLEKVPLAKPTTE